MEPISRNVKVKELTNVTLICDFTGGSPRPLVNWIFNGESMPISSDTKYDMTQNRLIIKNVSSADAGEYTCTLSNGFHESKSLKFNLNVLPS